MQITTSLAQSAIKCPMRSVIMFNIIAFYRQEAETFAEMRLFWYAMTGYSEEQLFALYDTIKS